MNDQVFDRFKSRLEDLGLAIDKIDDEGLILIEHGENTIKISLDNVRKSYAQDGHFDHLENLINSIHEYIMQTPLPPWKEGAEKVFWSLFPSNYDFQDFINERVTDDFYKNYVYYDNGQYTWIDYKQLDEWKIDELTFKEQVDKNMNALLEKSKIELLKTKSGARLACFEIEIEGLKSALLFTKSLRKKVSPILGFPIYCVLPVRDFCYMFGEEDKEQLINSLGEIVLKEFKNSGYKITTEIIKISDTGIEVIGKYQE